MADKPVTDTKRCGCCHEVKPLEDFYRHSTMADGRHNECKACARQQQRDYFARKAAATPRPCATPGCEGHATSYYRYCVDCRQFRDRVAADGPSDPGSCDTCVFLRECRKLVADYSPIMPYCFVTSKYHHRYLAEYPASRKQPGERVALRQVGVGG